MKWIITFFQSEKINWKMTGFWNLTLKINLHFFIFFKMGGQNDIRKYRRRESQFQSSVSSSLWNVSRRNDVHGGILYCQSLQKTKKSTQHWSPFRRGRRTRKAKIQPIHIFSASIVWHDCNIYTVYCTNFDICVILSNVERYIHNCFLNWIELFIQIDKILFFEVPR